ncbi:MAG: thiol reductant ABC exporter subunit CydC [Ignavibacteriaceae bacterium]|nr:thiol reductant ABC exporter subunit CydC [Ignavibacteriaceae bacterium]
MKTFLKIVSLGKDYKLWMLFAVLLGFITVGSGIGLMMTSSYLIAKAAIQTPIYQLQVAIVGVRFFGIARGVFRYLERYISHKITFKLLAKFRVWFYKSLIPLVPSKTIDYSSGDLLTRSIEDIESLEHIFVRVISPPFILVLTCGFMFVLLNQFSITYALIFLAIFLSSAIGIPILTYLLSSKLGKKIIVLRTELKNIAIDGMYGLSELIIYQEIKNWKQKFIDKQNELLKAEYKMNLIKGLHESLTGLAMNLTVAALLFVSIPDVTRGLLDGVYLAVITIGIMASYEIVFQIPLAFQYLSKSIEAGSRLLEITEQKAEITNNLVHGDVNFDGYDLKVHNVSFSYDGKAETLENISFEVKENQILAIVGASGAGKSTLVNILTRLWSYNKGEISIGGISYSQLSSEKIREIISVVPQKTHLFAGTIKENLLIANENASDEEMYNVLEQVDLKNMILNLPEKLNTHIGEFGKKLSGGEIKRLAIARSLLRNTPILIFDEATSHLDNLTEGLILSTIKRNSHGKRIIFITHRLTRMDMFDQILVFQNGRIVERGSSFYLTENGKYYPKLIRAQTQTLEAI